MLLTHSGDTMIRKSIVGVMPFCIFIFTMSWSFAEEKEGSRWGIAPIPAIGYMPETSLLAGAAAVLYHTAENKDVKPDTFTLLGYYSLKNQYQICLKTTIHFSGDMLIFRADGSGSKFPTLYYGVGAGTHRADSEKYTSVYFPVSGSLLYKFTRGLYAGIAFDQQYQKLTRTENGGTLAQRNVTGSKAMLSSGTGLNAVYDSRDSDMNPHRGEYVEVKMLWFGSYAGGDSAFGKGTIDARKYFPVGSSTLCFQLSGSAVSGDIPFYYYPSLGGSQSLRGFYYGRYIDKDLIFSQVEYRFTVWRFVGMTFFTGIGDVAPALYQLGEHPRLAAGLGLRFMLDTDQKINLRLDMSYNGRESYGYLNILEAF